MADDIERGATPDEEARRATTAARPEGDRSTPSGPTTPSRRRLTSRQKVGAGVVGVLSAALIVVSSAFLISGADPADGQSAQTNSTQVSVVSESEGSNDGFGSEGEEPAEASDREASSPDGAAPSTDVSGSPDPDVNADANAGNAPSVYGDEVASDGPASQSLPEPAAEPSSSTAPASIAVSVSISSSAVGNPVSGGATVSFSPGATAYDALMACGLSVNATSSQFGAYVSAIGGLAEKEHGATSGWLYSVNGTTPGVSCSSYVLQDGDDVQWFYTT